MRTKLMLSCVVASVEFTEKVVVILDQMKNTLRNFLAKLPIKRFGDPRPVVGVLRLDGVIGRPGGLGRQGISLANYERAIDKLFSRKNLKAVALVVNSPGGSPVQSALIAKRLRDLAAEKELLLVSFCEDVAASGGYWLACAGDQIYANANSIVGSIGVISAGFGFPELIERFGIERRVYATNSRKGMLDPFQDEKPEDIDRLRELQEDIFENFKVHVRECRGDRLKADETTLFSGDIWTGSQALEIGLIDGLADMRSEMQRRYGKKVEFQSAGLRRGLLSRLRAGRMSAIDPFDLVWALDDWTLWKRFGL